MAYRTLHHSHRFVDEPIQGSRFAGWVAPVRTERQALDAIAAARAEWPDASHYTYAWRLREGHHRTFDDGEPGGSAGRPILSMIDGRDVVDVVVIVARWFGGTKLGVGGLIRAYGGCAGRTLDRAEIVEREVEVTMSVVHSYDDTAAVQAAFDALDLSPDQSLYLADVTHRLRVPEPRVPQLHAALQDRTAGRVRATAPPEPDADP